MHQTPRDISKARMTSIVALNTKNGFTLIELMIVIAIIGALAAIAIPNFIAYRNKAYCEHTEVDAHNILSAITSYYSEPDNVIPPGLDVLINDEDLALSNSAESVAITPTASGFRVTVTDDSGRCPRGTTFTASLGEDKGHWD